MGLKAQSVGSNNMLREWRRCKPFLPPTSSSSFWKADAGRRTRVGKKATGWEAAVRRGSQAKSHTPVKGWRGSCRWRSCQTGPDVEAGQSKTTSQKVLIPQGRAAPVPFCCPGSQSPRDKVSAPPRSKVKKAALPGRTPSRQVSQTVTVVAVDSVGQSTGFRLTSPDFKNSTKYN